MANLRAAQLVRLTASAAVKPNNNRALPILASTASIVANVVCQVQTPIQTADGVQQVGNPMAIQTWPPTPSTIVVGPLPNTYLVGPGPLVEVVPQPPLILQPSPPQQPPPAEVNVSANNAVLLLLGKSTPSRKCDAPKAGQQRDHRRPDRRSSSYDYTYSGQSTYYSAYDDSYTYDSY